MTANTSIKVSAETRDRLAKIAREHFHGSTVEQTLKVMLDEYERRVHEIQDWYKSRPELVADIRGLASQPVSEMIAHRDVIAMFETSDQTA
jgi:hypothetical protein